MGNYPCTPYDREATGFRIQTVSPVAINMLETSSLISLISSEGGCTPPHDSNLLTLPATELLAIRQTLSDCSIPRDDPSIGASTKLAILQMKENNVD